MKIALIFYGIAAVGCYGALSFLSALGGIFGGSIPKRLRFLFALLWPLAVLAWGVSGLVAFFQYKRSQE